MKHRANLLREELGFSAGKEPLEDRFKCGYIAAVTDLLGIEFDEVAND